MVVDTASRTYGAPEQRAAGWEAEHYAVQAVLAECGQRRGIEYTVQDWEPHGSLIEIGPVDLPVMFAPALADFGVARWYLARARFRDSPAPRLNDVERARVKMFGERRNEAASMGNHSLPGAQAVLERKFRADQATIHHDLGERLIGWYSTCMTHAGSPADSLNGAPVAA